MAINCIFCDIIQGRSQAYIVYENAEICCFLDNDPINEGHCLIVPKQHLTELVTFTLRLQTALIRAATLISRALITVYNPHGISMMQNGGMFDEIGHFHLHVFPRYKADGFGWTETKDIDKSDFLQTQRKELLIQALKS